MCEPIRLRASAPLPRKHAVSALCQIIQYTLVQRTFTVYTAYSRCRGSLTRVFTLVKRRPSSAPGGGFFQRFFYHNQSAVQGRCTAVRRSEWWFAVLTGGSEGRSVARARFERATPPTDRATRVWHHTGRFVANSHSVARAIGGLCSRCLGDARSYANFDHYKSSFSLAGVVVGKERGSTLLVFI